MSKVQQIKDKSLNLEVQGQGCWDDCYIAGHWELRASSRTFGCVYYSPHYNAKTNPFL